MILRNEVELKQNNFKTEKEMQNFVEKNIAKIFKYRFLATEFVVGEFRLDTVAFDEETKAFVIIEYKNGSNQGLTDQGLTYLRELLCRKEAFVLLYNQVYNKNESVNSVYFDWTQSKIIFVSPIYNSYQLGGNNYIDLPIELYKITKYDDDIVVIDRINKSGNVKFKNLEYSESPNGSREIVARTEEDHLKVANEELQNVYQYFRERVLNLGDIDVEPKKVYIAFKGYTNICDVEIKKNFLKVHINLKNGKINDPNGILEIAEQGHWGNGDYQYVIENSEQIDIVMPFIKQSYEVNKK